MQIPILGVRRRGAVAAVFVTTLLCVPTVEAQRGSTGSAGRGSEPAAEPAAERTGQAGRGDTSRTGQAGRGDAGQAGRGSQEQTQQARTQQARTEQARTQQARQQNARVEQARGGADRGDAAGRGSNERLRRAYSMSPRERILQDRLENAGILGRRGADADERPIAERLREAGAMPRVRMAMADLRTPARQPRSPRLSRMQALERPELMRTLFDEEAKHRARLAQIERLEALANGAGDGSRAELLRSLREVEVERQRRVLERGDEILGAPGTFRSVVDELETRSIGG